ncbi:hypothetical protein DCC79_15200 [bacterium]|nr:MAG: hypothetical protein DCC79_15200 [bacterium]
MTAAGSVRPKRREMPDGGAGLLDDRMRGRRACALAAGLWLAGALALAGCTRARPFPTGVASSTALPPPAAAAASPAPTAVVELAEPTAGTAVTSPIRISGTARLAAGRTLAAQVFSRSPDGGLRWRGNARLDVDADGRFTGTVTYTLPIASPGLLELAVVDAADGRVLERRASEIALAAAP